MNTMLKKDYYQMTGKKWGISSYLELLMMFKESGNRRSV